MVLKNSAIGNKIINPALSTQIKNSTIGNQIKNSALCTQIKNSAIGNQIKNSALGTQIKNSALGTQKSAIGNKIINSALGTQIKNSAISNQIKKFDEFFDCQYMLCLLTECVAVWYSSVKKRPCVFLEVSIFLNVMSMSFAQEKLGLVRNKVVGQKLVW